MLTILHDDPVDTVLKVNLISLIMKFQLEF